MAKKAKIPATAKVERMPTLAEIKGDLIDYQGTRRPPTAKELRQLVYNLVVYLEHTVDSKIPFDDPGTTQKKGRR